MVSTSYPKFSKPNRPPGPGRHRWAGCLCYHVALCSPHHSLRWGWWGRQNQKSNCCGYWPPIYYFFSSILKKEKKEKKKKKRCQLGEFFLQNSFIGLHMVCQHSTLSLLLWHTSPLIPSLLRPIFHRWWYYCVGLQVPPSSEPWGQCRLPWLLSDSAPWTQISQGPSPVGLRYWTRSLCWGKHFDFSLVESEMNSLEGQDSAPVKKDTQGE